KKKKWKFPTKWKMQAKKASKHRDAVLIFYLNLKGELEQPLVVPIYSGNMVVIRDDDTVITFTGVVAGTIVPIQAKRINSTSTTATSMVALF
ncbi:hypothetical protein LCGC14_1614670, partial [marine sediment metagenome]